MQFTIQDASTLDPAVLADELVAALGSNFGISTAGTTITTNSQVEPDVAAFQAVLAAHVINAALRQRNKRIKGIEQLVQKILDDAAKAAGYDGILSACSYAAIPNHFQAEAISFLTWRSAVWAKCYADLAANPDLLTVTDQQILAGLPARV